MRLNLKQVKKTRGEEKEVDSILLLTSSVLYLFGRLIQNKEIFAFYAEGYLCKLSLKSNLKRDYYHRLYLSPKNKTQFTIIIKDI